MGKPLSRPDCLRQSPACLGKGDDEDGYIEDCYVPQRSIYDTMRINEQIDQGSKPNQPSKNTLEKGDGSTISSNGTLGAPSAFESKVPESKKLDERVIFDALKLSSDVSKPAAVPPRRRPNPEKKENINRRSWKSFMPPNFPEFAERIEASLSEVSEAGVSNPSLQEKQESSTMLAESSRQPEQGETLSEPLTMEHISKPPGVPALQEVKQLSEAFCDFSQDECQPLLEPEGMVVSLTGGKRWDPRLSSATWPRAMKNAMKAGLSVGRHDTLEADDTDCVIEAVPLSPCLSEELLDPGMHILITPSLREKTESELRFEEDERLIMMEAEEEWEDGSLPEKGKTIEKRCCLTGISEEKEQLNVPTMTVAEAAESVAGVQGTSNHPSHWQAHWDDSQPPAVSSALVPQETHRDLNAAHREDDEDTCNREAVTTQLKEEGFASSLDPGPNPLAVEQFSDTDSVQMFLELENFCMNEEEGDGAAPVDPELQVTGLYPEDLDMQKDLEQISENSVEAYQHTTQLEISMADSAVVSDLEDFETTFSSQVASTAEPTISESYSERETSGDSEKVTSSGPPVAKNDISQHSLSSLVSQIEEYGTELLTTHQLAKDHGTEGLLDFAWGEPVISAEVSCCQGPSACSHVFAASGMVEEDMSSFTFCGIEASSPSHDEFATSAKELESQPDFNLIKDTVNTEGRDLEVCFEPNPSERTDFSTWDVPELVSEDEVAELDKENILYEGKMNETENTGSSWVPLQSDLVPKQDSEVSAKCKDFSEDLKAIDSSMLLPIDFLTNPVCDAGAVIQEEEPKATEQITEGNSAVQVDFLECGDLELLFGQGGEDEVERVRDGDAELECKKSLSPLFVQYLRITQPDTEDFVSPITEEIIHICPVPSNKAFDAFPESTKDLASTSFLIAIGPSTIAGPAAAQHPPLSPVLTASAPVAQGSIVDAPSLSSNEEPEGTQDFPSITLMSSAQEFVPALPDAEEASSASLPSQPPSREEQPSLELVWVAQELEVLAPALPLGAAAVEPLELEGGHLSLAPGALWDTAYINQQLPASTASEIEEELTSVVPDIKGPSLSSPAVEGPPAGTDGLVPDNEVFFFLIYPQALLCQTFKSLCRELGRK